MQSLDEAGERAIQELIDGLVTPNQHTPAAGMSVLDRVEAIDRALENPDRLSVLLHAVFPGKPLLPPTFFERLHSLQDLIGFSETANRVVGRVWSAALRESEPKTREVVLAAFISPEADWFWPLLGTLYVVLGEVELQASFSVPFLSSLSDRVSGDLGSGGFWKAVQAFCDRQPSVAISTIDTISIQLTDAQMELATRMLGTLRSVSLQRQDQDRLTRVSEYFSNHATIRFRTIFNQSWVMTASHSGMTTTELQNLFDRHDAGTIDEKNDILGVVCRIAAADSVSQEVRELCRRWIHCNASTSMSSTAKFCVVILVESLGRTIGSDSSRAIDDPSVLLLKIQPIPVADLQTWSMIERHLVKLLQADVNTFSQVFISFAEGDPTGVHTVLHKPGGFQWLLNEMGGKNTTEVVTRLIVSGNTKCRRLGLYLFDHLASEILAPSVLDDTGERDVQVAFHEFQRTIMHGAATARFLVSLLPRVGGMNAEFQKLFYDELLLRARDLLACRRELERLASDAPMVQQVLHTLSRYFEDLERSRNSFVGAMEVPGYRRAIRLFQRRFSKEVSEGVKERSIMMQLCKQIELLYGSTSSSYVDGRLSAPNGLTEFSHTMELPVVEFSDPEGMLLRRCQLLASIVELTGVEEAEDLPETQA